MARVPLEISHQLTRHIKKQPFDTYAVACRYPPKDIATQAAKATLRAPAFKVTSLGSDYLSLINIDQYQRLAHYRIYASEVAAEAVAKFAPYGEVGPGTEGMSTVAGCRYDSTSCMCSPSRCIFKEVTSTDTPLYIMPWLQKVKEVAQAAVQHMPDWAQVPANSALALQAMEFAMDSNCSICMREILRCNWTIRRIGEIVTEAFEQVSSICCQLLSHTRQSLIRPIADTAAFRTS